MTRPEIHLTEIHETTLPYEGRSLADMVQEYAHALADYQDLRIYPRPFRAIIPTTWQELDLFNIDEAVVYNASSIETWIRHPHHWDVVITNFTMTVPIIN